MRKKALISVIMPVYNIRKSAFVFRNAIHSVLQQSYHDIELLVVNDGSTDGSEEILNKMAQNDNRIVCIFKENGGVESARREGLRRAKGDFVFHMDQDDLLDSAALEKLVNAAHTTSADVVVGNSARFYGIKQFAKYPAAKDKEIILSNKDFMKTYYKGFFGNSIFPVQIWNKLYRKSFLDSIPEPPKTNFYNEDFNYNIHVLPEAKKIVWIPDVTYFYRWGGFTCKKIENLQKVALSCYQIEMKQIEKYSLWDFEPSTCIELLNFMNSAIYQEIQFEKEGGQIKKACIEIMSYPEVKQALLVVKEKSKYRNAHINKMLIGDIDGWISCNTEKAKREKIKITLKRLLSR